MGLYYDLMEDFLSSHRPKYKLEDPEYLRLFSPPPRKKTLGERYLEELIAEGDEERVFKKYLAIGTRQPGASRERVRRYLENVRRLAAERGII